MEDNYVEIMDYEGSYNKRFLKQQRLAIVCWPDTQELMEREGFHKHSWLINDEYGIKRFGSCAYVVEESWLDGDDENK